MGNSNKKEFTWEENYHAYKEWKKSNKSLKELKKDICFSQYGYDRECKLVWFPLNHKKRLPLVICKDTNLNYLEKKVFPQILNRYVHRTFYTTTHVKLRNYTNKHQGSEFYTQKNFYNSLKDFSKVYPVELEYNGPCFCFKVNTY